MADTRYVVFGASGHVGSIAATRLLDAGKKVRVVARKADGLKAHAARGSSLINWIVEIGRDRTEDRVRFRSASHP